VSGIQAVESDRDGVVVRDTPVEEAVERLLEYLEARGVFAEQHGGGPVGKPRGPRLTPDRPEAICVVAELMGGEPRAVTFELLGSARELALETGARTEALLVGHDVERHVATLTAYGADRVHVADDPRFALYDTELYSAVVVRVIEEHRPYAVLVPSTIMGRDLAARVAARLGLGLTGDCIGLEVDSEGRLIQLKPAFGGNIVAPILSRTMPQMTTVRPGVLAAVAPDWSVEADVRRVSLHELPEPRVRVLESVTDVSAVGGGLEHARVIVAVGKGVGGPENISVVRELAEVLGAPLGATRDVVDLGWLPRQHQIGLSGKSVAPDLYIAVAVRGPFNHTVGIKKAGTVVAINNSARAPIFRAADFGIVGDYAEIVPALANALRERRGESGR
jgi:electron transfer flavoprotein alpha subunit